MYLGQRRQAMLQLHLSDQQFNCLLKCVLYYRLDKTKHSKTVYIFYGMYCTSSYMDWKCIFSPLEILTILLHQRSWCKTAVTTVHYQWSYHCTFEMYFLCVHFGPNFTIQLIAKGPMDNKSALIQVMIWCGAVDKPLYELMLTQFKSSLTLIWIQVLQHNFAEFPWIDRNMSNLVYEPLVMLKVLYEP